MIKLTPKHAEADPLYTLHVLHTVAEALAAVFGSSDGDLLGADDVRAGFMHVATGLGRSLEDLEEVVADRFATLRKTEKERDAAQVELAAARAELASAENAYAYVEAKYFATPGHEPLDLAEAAAFFRRRKEGVAPDLTEPAPQATGGQAAIAG